MLGHKKLSILYVAYPLLSVSETSAGGAEQVLFTLEREVASAGHRTVVAASSGSTVSGQLMETGNAVTAPDDYERREREHNERILEYLNSHPNEFDLIHDHSGSFWRFAAECPIPVVATLHLPRGFYRKEWFLTPAENLFFTCVSESQADTFRDLRNLLGAVQNGISLERVDAGLTPRSDAQRGSDYLFWLGRICEEKAPHLAIEAARAAGRPLVLAGQVYPLSYHRAYFERCVLPQLSTGAVRLIELPTFAQKLDLLSHARCVLLTSTAEETSSLVAMEAMACGTPVVAVRRGAFPEIVSDGETGFIVESPQEMAKAISHLNEISPAACRARVEKHFSSRRMVRAYLEIYDRTLNANRRVAA